MKSVAVFLILNILLLSWISGMAHVHRGKATCCMGQIKKDFGKQQHSSDDCAKGTCNALLSCGTCGFIIVVTIKITPVLSVLNRQAVHSFLTGELSDYQDQDWNPPKV